jgi:hypothetical protein
VKIDDLKGDVYHVRQLNENYRNLVANCYTLEKRCYNELLKTFSSVRASSKEKNFLDGDLEGLMCWVLSETRAYKSILSTREDCGAWILSHPVLEGKPNANHVRARISYSRTQQLHNIDIITQCSK